MGYDAKPRSAERLDIKSVDKVRFKGGRVEMVVTLTYEPWVSEGAQEFADAIKTLDNIIYKAQVKSLKKRQKKILDEMGDIFAEAVDKDSES